jgi:RHS repeat-associated protein
VVPPEPSRAEGKAADSLRKSREFLVHPESHEPLVLFDEFGPCTFECDNLGTPRAAFDAEGRVVAQFEFTPFGAERSPAANGQRIPFRLPGQFADSETGLNYSWFRYYDPTLRIFERMDPLGIDGGLNAWNYVPNPLAQIDPFGLIPVTDPGHNVYGLYDPPRPPMPGQKPYYVGITDNLDRRAGEHVTSGRLDPVKGGYMEPLDRNVTYGTARGYEQAYIETHGTKTGTIGDDISATNRGNKVNSFDHDSATRKPKRQKYLETAYEKKMKALKGCG